jgi:type III pantothenate kinase
VTLLVVDIGNTTTKVGVWKGGAVRGLSVGPTSGEAKPGDLVAQVTAAADAAEEGESEVALCSVVPAAATAWAQWCERESRPAFIVQGDMPSPLVNRYGTPSRLGPDRLAAAVGAARRCGAPVIVASVGTTVFVDAVSSSGEYLGGAIWVGMAVGFDALAESAAALPKASRDLPASPIGADTEACIRVGAVYGTASLIDGLASRLREAIGRDAPLVVTGGDAELLSPYLRVQHEVVPTLILEGIAAIWEHNRGRSDANR